MMNQTIQQQQQQQPLSSSTRQSSTRPLGPPWLTTRKQRTLVILPRISGFLSMLGSGWIIYEVVRGSCGSSRKKKMINTTYHRLLLAMSVTDFLSSFWMFIGSWAVPKQMNKLVLGASGSTATCTAQGFFNQLGMVATGIYSSSLAAYYLLVIRYGWKEDQIKKTAEIWMHAVPLVFGLSTAFAGVGLDLYNMALFSWCFIAASPPGCTQSYESEDGTAGGTCTRGDNATIFIHIFFQCPIWICIVFITISTYLVYKKVWSIDKKAERWNAINKHSHHSSTVVISDNLCHSSQQKLQQQQQQQQQQPPSAQQQEQQPINDSGFCNSLLRRSSSCLSKWSERQRKRKKKKKKNSNKRHQRRSRQVAKQGLFFVGAFYMTWLVTVAHTIAFHWFGKRYWPTTIAMTVTLPLQGFWNFLVYMRPRYIRFKEQHPSWNILKVLQNTFFPPVTQQNNNNNNNHHQRQRQEDDNNDDNRRGAEGKENEAAVVEEEEEEEEEEETEEDPSSYLDSGAIFDASRVMFASVEFNIADCCCAEKEDNNNVFNDEIVSRSMFASSVEFSAADVVLKKKKNQNVVESQSPSDDTQQQGDSDQRIETKDASTSGDDDDDDDDDGICQQQSGDNSSSTTLFFSSTTEDSLNNNNDNKEKDSSTQSSHNKKRVSFSPPSKLLDQEEEEEEESERTYDA